MDLRLRRPDAGRPRRRTRLGRRPRTCRAGVVAHLDRRSLLQQRPPLGHGALLLLHGRPPLGQVLHGRLAWPPRAHLDHRRGLLPHLDPAGIHRLPDPAEPRLAVDRRPGKGRAQCVRDRILLQRPQLRPDADVAHRPAAARRRAARRRPHPAGAPPWRRPAAVSAVPYPQHADPAREWTGEKRRYDLVREATIATAVVALLTVLLSLLFSSPDVKPVTVSQWA